jgi:signal transduction histidine kinase/CheY-like chemotaxis protein
VIEHSKFDQSPLVLVVDDDDIAREVLVKFLEINGYMTAQACNGKEAIGKWKDLSPDLILMDANMPVLDGVSACSEIRNQSNSIQTPILMVTGIDRPESIENAFMAGAEEYITKPIHWPVLKHRMRKILERLVIEESLRKNNEEMEIRVLERTRELIKVNEALYASEYKFRSLVDASPDTIIIVDSNCQVSFSNHSPPGIKQSDLMQTRLIEQLPIQSRPRFQLSIQRVFGNRQADAYQIEGPSSTWWQIRMTPLVRFEENSPHSTMMIVTDKTEQHNTQNKAMRNARLATVGTLAASVAHEINNPNNAILLQSSWLAKSLPEFKSYLEENNEQVESYVIGGQSFPTAMDRFSEFVTSIIKNSKRIGTITKNLKEMSKPDDGTILEEIEVHKLFEAVLSILANQLNNYCNCYTVDIADNLPKIYGNAQQLEQVFINLILNALQSTPDKIGEIRITAKYNKDSEKIVLRIQDEGVGIPQENLEKIFLPFFTTKLDKGGTGLGLSICQSILSKHDGCIEVFSTPETGTEVRVDLPRAPYIKGTHL